MYRPTTEFIEYLVWIDTNDIDNDTAKYYGETEKADTEDPWNVNADCLTNFTFFICGVGILSLSRKTGYELFVSSFLTLSTLIALVLIVKTTVVVIGTLSILLLGWQLSDYGFCH